MPMHGWASEESYKVRIFFFDQVRVFRKSAVDIARLIKRALDFDVSLYSSSELFICTAISYLRRLKRFEKITEMMQ